MIPFYQFCQRISGTVFKICFSKSCLLSWMTKQTYFQGIMQEFNLGVGSDVSITLWCELCSWEVGGGGGGRDYNTTIFAYMEHLFCWQLILIFLYLTSNKEWRQTILWFECSSSSYCFPYFLPYENCLFLLSLKT